MMLEIFTYHPKIEILSLGHTIEKFDNIFQFPLAALNL